MERVYLDTNVLFPMTLMDLMLSMAEDFHHDVVWRLPVRRVQSFANGRTFLNRGGYPDD